MAYLKRGFNILTILAMVAGKRFTMSGSDLAPIYEDSASWYSKCYGKQDAILTKFVKHTSYVRRRPFTS